MALRAHYVRCVRPIPEITWVILTMGDRPAAFRTAAASVTGTEECSVVVVNNGAATGPLGHEPGDDDVTISPGRNLGIPGGRDAGVKASRAPIVGFLDDDAEFRGDMQRIVDAFDADDRLGAVSLHLVDEDGATARRHVPRAGGSTADDSGDVALFLGGACAIRRTAYDGVGGYFTELFYGHEELELSWRLVDAGWRIEYLADVEVFHPRTDISRHAEGWRHTGRNRVWIARRTLPWPVAIAHVAVWLVLGTLRAPAGSCRRAYVGGWRDGWRRPIDRRAISWRGVWRLTKLGRPPII